MKDLVYYTTAIDGRGRFALLAGPFAHHAAALDAVDDARRVAQDITREAIWWRWGTAGRVRAASVGARGKLNAALGLPT